MENNKKREELKNKIKLCRSRAFAMLACEFVVAANAFNFGNSPSHILVALMDALIVTKELKEANRYINELDRLDKNNLILK